MPKRNIPKFKSENEEAEWWDKNREELDKDFLIAAKQGRLGRLTRDRLHERIKKSTRVISIRLAKEDLQLAQEQAAAKGLPYQTYIKSLLHEALRKTG
jgi:predicted DNA binding CopG/RHH family protein